MLIKYYGLFRISSEIRYKELIYSKTIWNSTESAYMINQFNRILKNNQYNLQERSLGI
jgi:hypothetical protein